MRKNKRGWITVLEATIAVMLVSGVLVVVYVGQDSDETPIEDYIFSLQKQILLDIASRSDLRNSVLIGNQTALDIFASSKVPTAYKSSVKVCNLSSTTDHCKLNTSEVAETYGKDLFVEGIIVSSELGNGTTAPIYLPKKVKLFIWENR